MISKERLEELIKEKATIYILVKKLFIAGASSFIDIIELPLKNYHGISVEKYNKINNCKPHLYQGGEFMPYEKVAELEECFETEEDARWELEMTATRTETLKLANYTDFENENGDRIFYHKGITYELSLWWASDNTKIIRVTWRGKDDFGWLFEKPLTKENYISACLLCKKLFLGENNDK